MHDNHPQSSIDLPVGSGHEPSEVAIKRIFIFGAGLTVATILVMGAILVLMGQFAQVSKGYEKATPALYADESGLFPAPTLQRNDSYDMSVYRAKEADDLRAYRWSDPSRTIAQIPVTRAIEILAERGLPKVANKPKTNQDESKTQTPAMDRAPK